VHLTNFCDGGQVNALKSATALIRYRCVQLKNRTMKLIIIVLITMTSVKVSAQSEELTVWINQIGATLVQFEDLDGYSHKPIDDDVMVDFISVSRYQIEETTDSTFTIFVDPGKGEFCSHVTFNYIKEGEDYFLVFDDVKTEVLFGKEKKTVKPWTMIINDCKKE